MKRNSQENPDLKIDSGQPICLALGGGSAWGFTHLGVLKCLDERKLKPAVIAGCSMGAIVAALYSQLGSADAAIAAVKKAFSGRTWGLFSINPFFYPAVFRTERIGKLFQEIFGSKLIEDLQLPVIITAADLKTGLPVYFEKGPLVKLLLASMSLPVVFPPVRYRQHLLVDGGIASLVPVEPLKGRGTLIACHAYGQYKPLLRIPNIFSFYLHNRYLVNYRIGSLEMEKADIKVYPDTSGTLMHEFHKLDLLAERGRQAMEAALSGSPENLFP
ncbi:MAG: patatin-like phospholipase family protein [Candidatus Wallbacteria bacterium]|nr:patatin-like phospholipase family protein [Candidatus Wallbacteria bacterium]